MINYEPALQGGYRRISGFSNDYGTVPGETNAPVLGLHVYSEVNDGIFAARKPASGNNYFHYWDTAGGSWTTPTTSGAPTMTGVTRVRFSDFNWGTPKVVMADGVNPAATWDGTTYTQITHASAPSAPSLCEPFATHMWLAGDPSEPYNLYFSAPIDETDFAPGNGAGVINCGFEITQIRSFRNQLFVFGRTQIKRVTGTDQSNFRVDSVTNALGCLSPDSVIEFNGDLLFLSPDGMRPISATDRIGDIELATVSKPVQTLFDTFSANEDLSTVTVLPVRRKSQFRLFFADSESLGLIGALRLSEGGAGSFEFSQLVGMEVNCGASGYIGDEEFVIHGNSTGLVYRQESGDNFAGSPIFSLLQLPYQTMEDPLVRKTMYSATVYMLSEGAVSVSASVEFDYGDIDVLFDSNFSLETEGAASYYGLAQYDVGNIYDGNPSPVKKINITGSGLSTSIKFATTEDQPSHTIQAVAIEYGLADRR
jgi:hypothetical protein